MDEQSEIIIMRKYDTGDSTQIRFYDSPTGLLQDAKQIGFINYGVDSSFNEDFTGREYKGMIWDTLLSEGYTGKGLIEQIMPSVFCDIKCRGADSIRANTPNPKIWDRFGFEKKGMMGDFFIMKKDISNLKCDCKCSVRRFEPEGGFKKSKKTDLLIADDLTYNKYF
jgi:hypothetical protein